MGTEGLTFNFTPLDQLNPAEFRTFYANSPSVALYHNNMSDYFNQGVTLVSIEPSPPPPASAASTTLKMGLELEPDAASSSFIGMLA